MLHTQEVVARIRICPHKLHQGIAQKRWRDQLVQEVGKVSPADLDSEKRKLNSIQELGLNISKRIMLAKGRRTQVRLQSNSVKL